MQHNINDFHALPSGLRITMAADFPLIGNMAPLDEKIANGSPRFGVIHMSPDKDLSGWCYKEDQPKLHEKGWISTYHLGIETLESTSVSDDLNAISLLFHTFHEDEKNRSLFITRDAAAQLVNKNGKLLPKQNAEKKWIFLPLRTPISAHDTLTIIQRTTEDINYALRNFPT